MQIEDLSCLSTPNEANDDVILGVDAWVVRHVAVPERYPFRFWRWRVKCIRCKKLDIGPFSSYEYADVRAYDESHRHAPSCQRRRAKDES